MGLIIQEKSWDSVKRIGVIWMLREIIEFCVPDICQ